MKILNDLRVTPSQTDSLQKQKNAAESFGDVLAQELKQTQGVTTESSETSGLQALAPDLAILAGVSATSAETASLSLQQTADKLDILFSDMENYAAQLRSNDTSSLRNAYATLQELSGSIAEIKGNTPELANSPELSALVNELDVLTTTEVFKFNRGDYL